jgi:hypothetical protein
MLIFDKIKNFQKYNIKKIIKVSQFYLINLFKYLIENLKLGMITDGVSAIIPNFIKKYFLK